MRRWIDCSAIDEPAQQLMSDMTEFLQITTTTGTRQDAEAIAAELISRRLAGCVQVGKRLEVSQCNPSSNGRSG